MANALSTGVSALLAFQRAMDTVSHNVANANTVGYSRQVVDLSTQRPDNFGSSSIGNGVQIAAVRRLYDDAIASQVRTATSNLKQLDLFSNYADRIDRLFSDTATGLPATLQQFSNSLEAVATSPNSATARQVLLSQTQTLVNRLQSYQSGMDTMKAQLNAQLETEAGTVSQLAANIADLNRQVIAARGSGLAAPNDLLDQRDRLVGQLSEHIAITTVAEENGGLNVFLGNGQTLVSATTAYKLQAVPGEFDRTEPRLTLTGYVTPADVTSIVSGGTLGGLLQLRSQLLQPVVNGLGQIALAAATLSNQQQAAGLDLSGNVGTAMFATGNVVTFTSGFNAGNATAVATRTGLGALTTADYQLRYDGTAWNVIRTDSSTPVAASGTGTAGSPLTFDGLSVVISGTPQNGDALLVRPTSNVISGLKSLLTAPEQVAAAAPLLTSAGSANTGNATISDGALIPGASWVRGNYTLQFTSASNWQVVNSSSTVVASGSYTAGAPINFNGMTVAVNGTPATGDAFAINDNVNGKGDGRNVRALIDQLGSALLNGGTISAADAAGRLAGLVGVQAGQAANGRDAQNLVLQDATAAMQNVSGVNLDEEGANLVRYQQAYQAAAKIIASAKEMFDTLLAATR
jgi:flagellar hook-associated protein 1 FlgK